MGTKLGRWLEKRKYGYYKSDYVLNKGNTETEIKEGISPEVKE